MSFFKDDVVQRAENDLIFQQDIKTDADQRFLLVIRYKKKAKKNRLKREAVGGEEVRPCFYIEKLVSSSSQTPRC